MINDPAAYFIARNLESRLIGINDILALNKIFFAIVIASLYPSLEYE